MLSVQDACELIVKGHTVLGVETVSLENALGRVLDQDLVAKITQPPFPASAMDGFAVNSSDLNELPVHLDIVGEAAAGHPFEGSIRAGQAVRIFTGAPVPEGADIVIMQENCNYSDDNVQINCTSLPQTHIRPAGFDFHEGEALIQEGVPLHYRHLALAAAMNYGELVVRRKPVVAILATGDELVKPGSSLKNGQIVSSIPDGVSRLIELSGGSVKFLGIASDRLSSLKEHLAQAQDVDIILTIGGASVGDHDLVQQALVDLGMKLDFWKIAMRPGKPLMVGKLGKQQVIGVPGNPVSAHICSLVFLRPLLRAMLGVSPLYDDLRKAHLLHALDQNGPRQHYMRSLALYDDTGRFVVEPIENQDSSLLASFAKANALIVREPHAAALSKDETVPLLLLDI